MVAYALHNCSFGTKIALIGLHCLGSRRNDAKTGNLTGLNVPFSKFVEANCSERIEKMFKDTFWVFFLHSCGR